MFYFCKKFQGIKKKNLKTTALNTEELHERAERNTLRFISTKCREGIRGERMHVGHGCRGSE